MKICIIGAGYVGLTTAACFSEQKQSVVCYDCNHEKIQLLKDLIIPIYEPNLEDMIRRNVFEKRLNFSNSLQESVEHADIIMICVGTPQLENNEPDLSFVWNCAHELKECSLKNVLIVLKSTVPVGTTHAFYKKVLDLNATDCSHFEKKSISIAFCPEFLKQGAAVIDTLKPERIIIGSDDDHTKSVLSDLYAPFTNDTQKIIFMPIKDAEMTKYAANAMLATRISFINEISLLCDSIGADIENIRLGIGSDSRIGPAFLHAGIGYGGSCFPKDVNALISLGHKNNIDCALLKSVVHRNSQQKKYLLKKIFSVFGDDLSHLTFACWGLSFKPETDDLRDAPSIEIINTLVEAGASIHAYDPISSTKVKNWLSEKLLKSGKLNIFQDMYECLKNIDALVLITEWTIFKNLDLELFKKHLSGKYIFDGRNQFDPVHMENYDISYFGIGRGRNMLSQMDGKKPLTQTQCDNK